MGRATRFERIGVVVIAIVGAKFGDGTALLARRGTTGGMLRASTAPRRRSIQSPVTRTKSASVAALSGGATKQLFRKHGHGWDGVARAIVTEMAHLLPPEAPTWPSWSGVRYYRADRSLVIDTYEGRWRDEKTGEGGTPATLLVRLLGSWGAARRWLRDGDLMHGLGPGPRREPRVLREKSGVTGGSAQDRFWNPVPEARTKEAGLRAPVPPPVDQLELWPEQSVEKVTQRNRQAAARHEAEEERRWQAEMAKLPEAERNYREAQRWKRLYRHGRVQ